MKTARKSDSQIMQILSQAGSGVPVSELCREHGMSSATFYKWRAKYGGMDTSMITRLKELEAENARLKKMYADERLKAMIIQEALTKIFRPGINKYLTDIWSRIFEYFQDQSPLDGEIEVDESYFGA